MWGQFAQIVDAFCDVFVNDFLTGYCINLHAVAVDVMSLNNQVAIVGICICQNTIPVLDGDNSNYV